MKQTERRGLWRGKGRSKRRGRITKRDEGRRGKGEERARETTEKAKGEGETVKETMTKHEEERENKEKQETGLRETENGGKSWLPCYVSLHLISALREWCRGTRQEDEDCRAWEQRGEGGEWAQTQMRKRWMGWEKHAGDFPEKNRCARLLAEFKVLVCNCSYILIGAECVRCLLLRHRKKSLKPARHLKNGNLWRPDTSMCKCCLHLEDERTTSRQKKEDP